MCHNVSIACELILVLCLYEDSCILYRGKKTGMKIINNLMQHDRDDPELQIIRLLIEEELIEKGVHTIFLHRLNRLLTPEF